jgi:hypothetical protein
MVSVMKIPLSANQARQSCIQDLSPDRGFNAFKLVLERVTASAKRTPTP